MGLLLMVRQTSQGYRQTGTIKFICFINSVELEFINQLSVSNGLIFMSDIKPRVTLKTLSWENPPKVQFEVLAEEIRILGKKGKTEWGTIKQFCCPQQLAAISSSGQHSIKCSHSFSYQQHSVAVAHTCKITHTCKCFNLFLLHWIGTLRWCL